MAKLGHVNAKIMRLVNAVRPPNLLEKLFVGDDLAGVLNQRGQQAVFDRRQMDFFTAYEHLPTDKIDPQAVQNEDGLARFPGILRRVA